MNSREKTLVRKLVLVGDQLSRALASPSRPSASDVIRWRANWDSLRDVAMKEATIRFCCTFYADVVKFGGLDSGRTLCSVYVDAPSQEEVIRLVKVQFPDAGSLIVKEAPPESGDDTAISKEGGDERR